MSEQEEVIALGNSALFWAEEAILSALGEPSGRECASMFAATLEHDMQSGKVDAALFQRCRAAALSVADVGLTLLDGVVTTIKQALEGEAPNREIEQAVAGMEKAIDKVMATRPGRIVPRNGNFGCAATEVGLTENFAQPI